MFHTRQLSGLATMGAILLLAACSDSLNDPLDPDEAQINLDVAAYTAEATADDIALMTAEADQITQAPAAPSDLEISRQVTFLDELGGEMAAYDPVLTASIHVLFSMQGSRSRVTDRGTVTFTVARERDFTISGLLGAEEQRTFNGTGASSKNRSLHSDENGDRTYDLSSTTLVEDVVILVPRGSSWPLSGTITRNVTVEVIGGLGDTRTREREVIVTFNGTNLVPVTINGVPFILDLETREIVPVDG